MSVQSVETVAGARSRGRDLALAGAFVAAAGLAGQAAILSMQAQETGPKGAARLAAGPAVTRDLAYTPQFRVADDSLRAFKPTRAWTPDADPKPAVDPSPTPAPVAALFRPAPQFRIAAAPLPPARPATLAPMPPPTLHVAARQDQRAKDVGFGLPHFVPTGADILRRLGDVGSSIGRMMRVSAR